MNNDKNKHSISKPFRFWRGEQGTAEWLQLRRNYVTGTDMATLFGVNPYCKTLYDLWEMKKLGKRPFVNQAMMRGSALESKALSLLKLKTGIVFSPAVVISEYHPIMSSLDGFDFSERFTAEIKTPAKGRDSELWKMAQEGKVPEHYMYQIQTGLLVTGAEKCYFMVYDGWFDGVIVEVKANPLMWPSMIEKAKAFYLKYLKGDEIPNDKAKIAEIDDPEITEVAKEYAELDKQIKALSKRASELKEILLTQVSTLSADKTIIGDWVEVTKSKKSIPVNWKEIIKEAVPGANLKELEKKYKESKAKELESEGVEPVTYRVSILKKKKEEKK